ncbi:hypothetical protein NPIL_283631 [Nephila pilipes]|uniref:Uncharacterized protein n=1 Tax=Nephila pilipes TaxID=299642 RepID=A0A8X6QM83_NEPPI|nr:hypothetical protein NPIL_283631 [Nephila pilipes]
MKDKQSACAILSGLSSPDILSCHSMWSIMDEKHKKDMSLHRVLQLQTNTYRSSRAIVLDVAKSPSSLVYLLSHALISC